MKLLFITQKINQNDDDLAFTILWIRELINQGIDVSVICLEKGDFDDSFSVYSLGKEKGKGKLSRILEFWKLIFTLKYDNVFVHMNPEYITLGGWYWFLMRKNIYLWYTHYSMHIHLRIAGILCRKMFAATKQSLPQFEGNKKKVVLGHGIDIDFWDDYDKDGEKLQEYNLVSVHRICRSKRLEIAIRALKMLPEEYNLTVYGRDVEKDYRKELDKIVEEEKLADRVNFMGPVPMGELRKVYPKFRLMVNMAPETIDKTVLEAMLFGIYPVTTQGNSEAVGLPIWPQGEEPQDIAKFILDAKWKNFDKEYLRNIVKDKHSLKVLISNIIKNMES